jgi:hypothetical protein
MDAEKFVIIFCLFVIYNTSYWTLTSVLIVVFVCAVVQEGLAQQWNVLQGSTAQPQGPPAQLPVRYVAIFIYSLLSEYRGGNNHSPTRQMRVEFEIGKLFF